MRDRRWFLKLTTLGSTLAGIWSASAQTTKLQEAKPIVVSTWEHGRPANAAAWRVLAEKGSALDAVEAGVQVPEADPRVRTVGYGGYPDRDGHVTLDACIMDHRQNCGSVAFLEHIKHPISVARKVMEETPHVMLVGKGALAFAESMGFKRENLLTEQAKTEWLAWRKEAKYEPKINIENHDTIGMLALDNQGNLSGACTTSGASYKMHGRVGDSPIIGAGLFVDNEVGAATATGMGELMMRTVGCHSVVEIMRRGASPQEACQEVVERIATKLEGFEKFQVGFLALNKQGEVGAYCIQPGFNYAVLNEHVDDLRDADSMLSTRSN